MTSIRYPNTDDAIPAYETVAWKDVYIGMPVIVNWSDERSKEGSVIHVGHRSARVRLKTGGWVNLESLKQFHGIKSPKKKQASAAEKRLW